MRRLSGTPVVVALILGWSLLATPFASAQTASATLPGITVQGTGQASAPAETATVVLILVSDTSWADPVDDDETAPTGSTPASTPGDAVEPIIDALVAKGLLADEIELLANPFSNEWGPYGGPVTMTLRFQVTDPTPEMLADILHPALTAATDAGLYSHLTGVMYGVNDCAALEHRARELAIEDARANAVLQADLLDVDLGEVIASRTDPWSAMVYADYVPMNACTPIHHDQGISGMWSIPPFDPTMPAKVTVQAQVELTFEIETPLRATPAG